MLLTLLPLLTFTLHATECTSKFQFIHGKRMMSNCEWNKHISRKNKVTSTYNYSKNSEFLPYSSDYDFSRTYIAESNNRYDAVNRNDSGRGMSLGIVQFNSRYSRELSRELGIKSWMSTKEIKRRLRTDKSKRIQKAIFNRAFVKPILKFAYENNITDTKVIEFLVDWRVNGMPKSYYRKINNNTSIAELVRMRNSRYKNLYRHDIKLVRQGKRRYRKYTRNTLKHWLNRSNSFLT